MKFSSNHEGNSACDSKARILNRRRCRRGASLVEAGIILSVFLTFVLGTLDFALGVFKYNIASGAARQGARLASVHGSLAPSSMGQWGPAAYSGKGNDTNAIAQAIKPTLVGLDSSKVTIQVQWLDGSNDFEKRVRVTVTTPYKPIMTSIFGNVTFNLTATSTVPIAH